MDSSRKDTHDTKNTSLEDKIVIERPQEPHFLGNSVLGQQKIPPELIEEKYKTKLKIEKKNLAEDAESAKKKADEEAKKVEVAKKVVNAAQEDAKKKAKELDDKKADADRDKKDVEAKRIEVKQASKVQEDAQKFSDDAKKIADRPYKVTYFADKAVLVLKKFTPELMEQELNRYCYEGITYQIKFPSEPLKDEKGIDEYKTKLIAGMKDDVYQVSIYSDTKGSLHYIVKNRTIEGFPGGIKEGTVKYGVGLGLLPPTEFKAIIAHLMTLPPKINLPDHCKTAFLKMTLENGHTYTDSSTSDLIRVSKAVAGEKDNIDYKLTDALQGENCFRINFLPLFPIAPGERPSKDKVAIFVERLKKEADGQETLVTELKQIPAALKIYNMVEKEATNYSKMDANNMFVLMHIFDNWRNIPSASGTRECKKVDVENITSFFEYAQAKDWLVAQNEGRSEFVLGKDEKGNDIKVDFTDLKEDVLGFFRKAANPFLPGYSIKGLAKTICDTYRDKTINKQFFGKKDLPQDQYIVLACAQLHGLDAMTGIEIDTPELLKSVGKDSFSQSHTFRNVRDETHLFALYLEAARINKRRREKSLPLVMFSNSTNYNISKFFVDSKKSPLLYAQQISEYDDYVRTLPLLERFKKKTGIDSSLHDKHLQKEMLDPRLKKDWKQDDLATKKARGFLSSEEIEKASRAAANAGIIANRIKRQLQEAEIKAKKSDDEVSLAKERADAARKVQMDEEAALARAEESAKKAAELAMSATLTPPTAPAPLPAPIAVPVAAKEPVSRSASLSSKYIADSLSEEGRRRSMSPPIAPVVAEARPAQQLGASTSSNLGFLDGAYSKIQPLEKGQKNSAPIPPRFS